MVIEVKKSHNKEAMRMLCAWLLCAWIFDPGHCYHPASVRVCGICD